MLDIILSFYFLLSIPMIHKLLPKHYIEFVSSNRIVQHILAFSAMIIIVHHLRKDIDFYDSIKYGLGLYCLFLLTTKMDLHMSIISICLLIACYFYESKTNMRITELSNDQSIDIDKKEQLILEEQKHKIYMYIGIALVLFGGTYLYSEKKKNQYGGGFDWDRFILG